MNELENQLKDLVLKHSGRVVFKQNDNRMIEWNGKEYEYYNFVIYAGANWYINDECIVMGLHVENDTLYYDIYYIGVNYKDDPCIEDNFDVTIKSILLRCDDENKENVSNTLQFLINLLKN